MASADLTFSASALTTCQQAFASDAGTFSSIGSGMPSAGAASFGTLSVSGQLSSLASQISSACTSEFTAAGKFLTATASALGQARQTYIKTEAAISAAAKKTTKN